MGLFARFLYLGCVVESGDTKRPLLGFQPAQLDKPMRQLFRHLAGISVDRFEPRTDFFARLKADTEKPGEPRAESSSGVVLAIRVQPGIEQHPSLRVLDQKDRDRAR